MKRTRLLTCVLLLAPALTFADVVTIDWTGQIFDYNGSSPYPAALSDLSDTSVSGVINLDTNALPVPDAGFPAGVASYNGSGFLQSSVQWAGGSFLPEPPGSIGSNSLYIDTLNNVWDMTDYSTWVDSLGVSHTTEVSLDLIGVDPLAGLLGLGSSGSGVALSGSGHFFDANVNGGNNFWAGYNTDSVTVTTTSVGEPDSAALALLAGGLLLVIMRIRPQNTKT